MLRALIECIVQQSPGAKKGSTAPYAWADLLLLEVGQEQPRSLANAYLDAISTKQGDVRQIAVARLAEYLGDLDKMYGAPTQGYRGVSSVFDRLPAPLPGPKTVPDNIEAALVALWS